MFNKASVFGQHAGVVDADAVQQKPLERRSEALLKAEAANLIGDRLALLAGGEIGAHNRPGQLCCLPLGKRHNVDGSLIVADEGVKGFLQRFFRVAEFQRHRSLCTRHIGRGTPSEFLHALGDSGSVAEGCGHEDELRLRQRQQRHLPRPAALGIAEVVEFVHDDDSHVQHWAFTQRLVGEDLRRGADDGSARVDRTVTGDHADVVGTQALA